MTAVRALSLSGAFLIILGGELRAQLPAGQSLPFGVGEELIYQVQSARFGKIGRGTMSVGGPDSIRGQTTYLLSFDLAGRVGPFRIEDRTRSWLDAGGQFAHRFEKRERHPLASRTEAVDLLPDEGRWRSEDGADGPMPTSNPLDELSFIYFIRTLDFEMESEVQFDRHFQVDRNPVFIRLVRREKITLPAGVFSVVQVEMQVRDGRRFEDRGVIRLYLTDDEHRYPVRIETMMPVVGKIIMDIESLTPSGAGLGEHALQGNSDQRIAWKSSVRGDSSRQ